MIEAIQNWDFAVLDRITANLHHPVLDWLMPRITMLAEAGWFFILMAAVFLCFKRTRKTGLMMGVALILGLALGNGVIKALVNRPRPYELREIELLIPPIWDSSFPSGHTLAAFEAAGVLMIRDRRFGIPLLALAIVLGFSRVYLCVHFPTDVIAGALLGLLFAWAGVVIVEAVWKSVVRRRAEKKTNG